MAETSRLDRLSAMLTPARTYYIFAAIYVPVAILFLNRGVLAEVILALYTFIMAVGTLMMVVKFAIVLAANADGHTGKFGTLYLAFVTYKFLPLLFAKVLAYVYWALLPTCFCRRTYPFLGDLVTFLRDVYWLFSPQYVLNWIIFGGLVVMSLLALWSVGHKKG